MTFLVTPALRDMRNEAVLLTALAASGIAWLLLLAASPALQIFVCGVDGVGPEGGAWRAERLIALSGMWLVMTVAMMLPAVAIGSLFSPAGRRWREAPDEGASRMRRPLIASLCSALLPTGEKREIVAAASFFFIVGYLGLASAISMAAAFCQWMLESIAVIGEDARIGNPMLAGLALAGIGVWHVSQFLRNGKAPCSFASDRRKGLSQGWRHGCSSLGCCLTMVGLQLAGGVMNVGLMIGLTLWMLLEAVPPWKRHLAAATGIALLTAGGLTIASAIG